MNTKQLKYVLVLAKEKSFSKAADVLNISQPSLSQYIKKIENQVGTELFVRSNGDVRLTDAGQVYVEAGRRILDIEHGMENEIGDICAFKTGSLIIGTSPFRSAGMIPTVASEFRKIYPGIRLTVCEATTAELLDAAEHGEYDLCLTVLPVNENVFTCIPIMTEELVVAVAENSEAAKSLTKTASPVCGKKYPAVPAYAFDGMRFVMLTDAQVMQKQLSDLCTDFGLNLTAAAVVQSLDAQIAMVREDIGAALVPTGIERIGGEKIRYFSIAENLPHRQVCVIYRKGRCLSKAANDLIAVMQAIHW